MSSLLSVSGLVKRFGGLLATDHFELELPRGELHALIGPNGAGKTTLMCQLTGELQPDAGDIRFDGESIMDWTVPRRALGGIARSYQITQLLKGFSVLENVMLMAQARQGHSFGMWKPVLRERELTKPSLEALERVGLAHRARDDVSALAHGEHRQLELAMALAMQPRLLLLDEPLAGMSQAVFHHDRFAAATQRPIHDPAGGARHAGGVQPGRPHLCAGIWQGDRLRRTG